MKLNLDEIYEVLDSDAEYEIKLGCYVYMALSQKQLYDKEMFELISSMLIDESEDAEVMASAFFECLGFGKTVYNVSGTARYDYLIELWDMELGVLNNIYDFNELEWIITKLIYPNLTDMYPDRKIETDCLMSYEMAFYCMGVEEYKKADIYINKILTDKDKLSIDEFAGFIVRTYILEAENYVNIVGNNIDNIEEILDSALYYIDFIENDEEYNDVYITFCLTASKVYLDAGDYKRAKIYADNVYMVGKEGFGDPLKHLAAVYNLVLISLNLGSVEEFRDYMKDAKDLIKEYDLDGYAITEYIYTLDSILPENNSLNENDMIKMAIKTLEECVEISSYNIGYIVHYFGIYADTNDSSFKKNRILKDIMYKLDIYVSKTVSESQKVLHCIAKAIYSIYAGDINSAIYYMNYASDIEFNSEMQIDILKSYIVSMPKYFATIFKSNFGGSVFLKILKSIPYSMQQSLKITDEMDLLRKLTGIGDYAKLVLAYIYMGKFKICDEELVEIVVNCKNLYGDILRIRRFVEQKNDDERYKKIDKIHREAIELHLRKFFSHPVDGDEIKKINRKRHDLEMQILEENDTLFFHWISFEEIATYLPENCFYVDLMEIPLTFDVNPMYKDLYYTVIALYKVDGRLIPKRFININLMAIRYQFTAMEKLLRESYGTGFLSKLGRKIKGDRLVLKTLYNFLLRDPVGQLDNLGIKPDTLILSGDAELSSFAFDALIMDDGRYLSECFEIINVNSIRNFRDKCHVDKKDTEGAMVIGNPLFTINSSLEDNENIKNKLVQIPLTKIEAQAAADTLLVQPVLREDAVKTKLYESDCRILHIASHGDHLEAEYGREMQGFGIYGDVTNPLSTTCMFFSGANDWIISGNVSEIYGNGILTGEELLTCRLNNLKFAVISACFSGGGDINYSVGLIGMRTAFLAIGVEAIITNLWEVDDLASAVIMTEFYKNILNMTVSEALWRAKQYLRNVTIEELKQEGWFGERRIRRLGLVADDMRELAKKPNDTRLFEQPFYWAGFILQEQNCITR